ncbi:MAG: hypothetical protein JWQ40_2120 [Segetibacter sp.]|jgi:hypothetical protein|nr:hypothetical protein [Segetibacter sp.]
MFPMLNEISITKKVCDILVLDILNQRLPYEPFEYIIYSEDHTMQRRGQFRAPSVQLRTTHMNEGTYELQLLYKGQEWQTTLFEKYTSHSAQ